MVARSAAYVASSRAGSAWATRTSEPPRTSGSVKEGSPDGTVDFGAVPTGLTKSAYIPEVDEGARAIEVPLVVPVVDWRTALDVAVPAHVVEEGSLALDEAPVLLARDRLADEARLERLARLGDGRHDVPPAATTASTMLT